MRVHHFSTASTAPQCGGGFSTLNLQSRNLLIPRENIVLVGFMGSGKSAVGRIVAERLRFQFVDTDRLIVERAGIPISEIFAAHGEEHFRDLESEALQSLDLRRRCVIATGGGAVLREKNRAMLRTLGFVVWLTASEDVIYDRVSRNEKRPLLQTADPRATITELLSARRPIYESAAQFTLNTTTYSHDKAAAEVIAAASSAFAWDSSR